MASWHLAKVGPTFLPFKKGHEVMTNCRDSLPKSLRSLRAAARSTGAADACIMHCGIQDLDCKILRKSMKNRTHSAFSNSGLEVELPAFQLPMFSKCDSLRKRDFFDTFVQGIHSRQIPAILSSKDIQLMKRSESQ